MANSASMVIDTSNAGRTGQVYAAANAKLDVNNSNTDFEESLKNFGFSKAQEPGLKDDYGNSEYDIYSLNYYQHNQYLPYNFSVNTNTNNNSNSNDYKAPQNDTEPKNNDVQQVNSGNSDAPNKIENNAKTVEHKETNNNQSTDKSSQTNENKSSSDDKTVDNNSHENISVQNNVSTTGQKVENNVKLKKDDTTVITQKPWLNVNSFLKAEVGQVISKNTNQASVENSQKIIEKTNAPAINTQQTVSGMISSMGKEKVDGSASLNYAFQQNDVAVPNQVMPEITKSLNDLNPAFTQDIQRMFIKTIEANPNQKQTVNEKNWFEGTLKPDTQINMQAVAEAEAKNGNGLANDGSQAQGKQAGINGNGLTQMLNLSSSIEGKSLSFADSLTKETTSLKQDTTLNLKLSELVQNTVNLVKSMPGNTTQVARITLKPPELGTVFVEISLKNNVANLSLQADSKEVVKSIQAQLEMLKDKLSQQGIKTESITVNLKPNEYELADKGYNYQNKNNKDDIEAREAFVRSFGNGIEDNSNNEENIPSLIENINKGISLERYI